MLVSEYCMKKDGEKLSSQHILNKAKKLCEEHKYTYEQVGARIFPTSTSMNASFPGCIACSASTKSRRRAITRILTRWRDAGLDAGAAEACASYLTKGLDGDARRARFRTVGKRHLFGGRGDREYLEERTQKAELVFAVAKKLGVKVQNPRAYIDEYAEKWLERGFEADSLVKIARVLLQTRI